MGSVLAMLDPNRDESEDPPYVISGSELTDAVLEVDENGIPVDKRECLKYCLFTKWEVTKEIFQQRFDQEQQARFKRITGIDEDNFEDDEKETANTFVINLPDEELESKAGEL